MAGPNDEAGKGHLLALPEEFLCALPTGAAKQAVEALGRRIAGDVYAPGEVMPNEAELAASLKVSRTTVRDAIKVLSGKGLVQTARRYGTRVRPVAEWNLLDGNVAAWHRLDHPRLARLFAETTELRSIVEPEAAALAAERADAAQVAEISAAAEAIQPGQADLQTLYAADCRFHTTILAATGNAVLARMRQVIVVMLWVSYETAIRRPDNLILSREGHVEVAEAIARRDAAAARAAMDGMLNRNRSIVEAVGGA